MITNLFRTQLRVAPLYVRRPLSTSTRLPNPLLSSKFTASKTLARPLPLHGQLFARAVANQVSGRPGSQTIGHAATNIQEELSNSAADAAKLIAGNGYMDAVSPTEKQTFLGITNAVAHSVPTPYIIMGLAGSLPYLASTGASIYLARQAGLAAFDLVPNMDPGIALNILEQALQFQMTYGAVMLSFLGAIHWGLEFAGYGGHKYYPRLLLGAAPVVWGWSSLALDPMWALLAQWFGFTGLWYADLRTTNAGWAPRWYSQYRFYLSILVGTCIIGSLTGISYWGPVGGHGLETHELEIVRTERRKKQPPNKGVIEGDIEAVPAPPEAEKYVIVRKKNQSGGTEGE